MDRKELTRRQLLREAAGLAAAASAGAVVGCAPDMLFPNAGGSWPAGADPLCASNAGDGGLSSTSSSTISPQSTGANSGGATRSSAVVFVQRDESILLRSNGSYSGVVPAVVTDMLDVGLKQLAASLSGADAGLVANPWTILLPDVNKNTRIGLKVNALNPDIPTHADLVSALISSLASYLPIDPTKVVVWDFLGSYLKTPGYTSEAFSGAQLIGTQNSESDTTGPGYRANPCASIPGSPNSSPRLSTILTDLTDLTINLPVLKVHGQAGVTGAMKNVYGMIDIPSSYHVPFLNAALPAIYNLGPIRSSIRLTILDALQAVILGDTSSPPTAAPGALFVSQDPVALDAYALDYMNALRAANSYAPVEAQLVGWMANAEQLGVGTSNYNLITA